MALRGWITGSRRCVASCTSRIHAELRARYVRGALPPTPQESSEPQPQLLAQAAAVNVAAKLASEDAEPPSSHRLMGLCAAC